jgi:competence CoiA-like predicted nuclease
MIWGMKDNQRIKASPKDKSYCELCNGELIAKCGEIKVWHWAHKSNIDCDEWYEPESEWHINWKNEFPKEWQERIIKKTLEKRIYTHTGIGADTKIYLENDEGNIRHRADIRTSCGKVIEFQSSNLSSKQISEREQFYDNMIWILNGFKIASGLKIRKQKDNILTFRWKHPPKSWWKATKPIYVDINFLPIEGIQLLNFVDFSPEQKRFWETFQNKVFLIKKIYPNIPCGGYGILIDRNSFLNEVKNGEKINLL